MQSIVFSPDYAVSLILRKFLNPVHPNLASVAVVVLSCPAPSLFLGHGRSPTLFVDHHGKEEEKNNWKGVSSQTEKPKNS